MTARCLLAIDNGSQSTKVSVIDEFGAVLASVQRPLRPYDTALAGRVVHPGDDLWDSIRMSCAQAVTESGVADRLVAVGLCTIRFCRVLLDADGVLVEPVLSWMDERVSRAYEAVDPRVAHVTTSSGYVTHRLTGRFVDTRANYQGVWPIDLATGEWSTEAAAYAETGMNRDLLSDLVDPGELLGTITGAASAATGIPSGLPVYATANDKAVEALGAGLHRDDEVFLSLGTYIAGMTVGSSAQSAGEHYWVNSGAVPGECLYESQGIRRGMWTVSWFGELVAGWSKSDDLNERRQLEDALSAEAALVPAGCGGLFTLLDWLAPTEAPTRRGAMVGFDGSQGRAHLYRSILEGIALTMYGHVSAMERELGRSFSTIVVGGGGSRSDLMMQVVADVFDRPAVRTPMPDAVGLGAAICAAVGAGVHPDWETARAQLVRPGTTFAPNPPQVAAYGPVQQTYARLTRFTDPLFAWTNRATPA